MYKEIYPYNLNDYINRNSLTKEIVEKKYYRNSISQLRIAIRPNDKKTFTFILKNIKVTLILSKESAG